MNNRPEGTSLPIHEKVFAYVTRGNDLLVFRDIGFEHFGLQVPAGSPNLGESLENAVLRETREETGLTMISLVRYLGSTDADQTKYGIEAIHRRHFYHLTTTEETPVTWHHEEKDPSVITDYTPNQIVFELEWIPLEKKPLALAEGHGAFLKSLDESIMKAKK